MASNSRVLRVGVSPYSLMHPECLATEQTQQQQCDPGMELSLLSFVMQLLNFSVKIVHSVDNGCGSRNTSTGNWTSLLGMLQRHEIDITGNLCKVYVDRSGDFGVSWPIWQDQQTFLIGIPKTPELQFNPLAPFTTETWLAIIGLSVCLTAAIAWVAYWRSTSSSICLLSAVKNAALLVEGSYFQYVRPPRNFLWVCGLFWLAATKLAFSSYIRSVLMYPSKVYAPFTNIDEFTEKLRTKQYILVSYHDSPESSLPFCRPAACKDLQQILQKNGFHYLADSSPASLLTAVRDNRSLVLVDNRMTLLSSLQQYRNVSRSDFWMLVDELNTLAISSFIWRKDFPYSAAVNRALIEISDIKTNIVYRKFDDFNQPQSQDEKLIRANCQGRVIIALSTIKGPIVYYVVALVAGVIVFIAELVTTAYQQNRQQPSLLGDTGGSEAIRMQEKSVVQITVESMSSARSNRRC